MPVLTDIETAFAAITEELGAEPTLALYSSLARQQLAILARIEALVTGATSATTAAVVAEYPAGADGLALLPKPAIVEEFDYETIVSRRKADLLASIALRRAGAIAAGKDDVVADLDSLGEYLTLESVPETILIEEAAWSEMLMRFRANEMYLSRLVYWSKGADLDNNAEDHGVERLGGEPDRDLKLRIRVKNRGSSAAGPDDWWRYHAMRAHEDVEDVAATRVAFPFPAPTQQRGDVLISVLAETVDGTPTQEMLDAVQAVLSSPSVRPVGSNPIVRSATTRVVDIAADVWLRPDAPVGTFEALEARLTAAWAATRALGWDVTDSWLKATLMAPGVQRVELPGWLDQVFDADEAPRLGTITLANRGRAF